MECATLEKVMDLKEKNLEYYDPELDYYFIIRVPTEKGAMYAYNQRTLVHDRAFARMFDTRRSAQRCVRLSDYEHCEILKIKREAKNQNGN